MFRIRRQIFEDHPGTLELISTCSFWVSEKKALNLDQAIRVALLRRRVY